MIRSAENRGEEILAAVDRGDRWEVGPIIRSDRIAFAEALAERIEQRRDHIFRYPNRDEGEKLAYTQAARIVREWAKELA